MFPSKVVSDKDNQDYWAGRENGKCVIRCEDAHATELIVKLAKKQEFGHIMALLLKNL